MIIWDRIFGTFAHEKEGEEIVYGLVFNQPSFNPVWLQVRENALIKNPNSSFSYVFFFSVLLLSVRGAQVAGDGGRLGEQVVSAV